MSADAFPAHESTRKRRRWGCTCGCVALLAVLAVVAAFGMFNFLRPTKTFPKTVLFDPAVNGFGVLRIDSTDDGESQLLKFAFKRAEQAQVQDMSEKDAKIIGTLLKVVRQFITSLVQTDCPVYLQYNPDQHQESIVSVVPLRNRLSYVLLRRFLNSHVAQPQDHKNDSDIYPLSKPSSETSTSVMAVSQTEFVYSDDLEMLNRSLDYRADKTRAVEAPENLQQYIDELSLDHPPAGEDLAIAMVNAPGRVENLITNLEKFFGVSGLLKGLETAMSAQKISFNDVLGLKISCDLVSVDRVKIETTFYFRQGEQATKFAAAAKQVLPAIAGKHEGTPFQFKQDVRTRGTPVVVYLDISGFKAWLDKVMPEPTAKAAEQQPDQTEQAETKEPAVAQ